MPNKRGRSIIPRDRGGTNLVARNCRRSPPGSALLPAAAPPNDVECGSVKGTPLPPVLQSPVWGMRAGTELYDFCRCEESRRVDWRVVDCDGITNTWAEAIPSLSALCEHADEAHAR